MRRYADDPCAVHPRVAHELADWLTTHSEEITRLRAEVERLRMTDAEVEAVYWAARAANQNLKDWCRAAMYDERFDSHAAKHEARVATLRALAERHGRDAAPIV
jgi:hypothetical protein